jgi:hypothetical protein
MTYCTSCSFWKGDEARNFFLLIWHCKGKFPLVTKFEIPFYLKPLLKFRFCFSDYFQFLKIWQPFLQWRHNFNIAETNRVVINTNPWRVMRVLGSEFGYHYSVTPLGGTPVVSTTGERRTCVWTLIRKV